VAEYGRYKARFRFAPSRPSRVDWPVSAQSLWQSHLVIQPEMICPEYTRLRQHYEAAIRLWGRVLLAPDANLVGTLARRAAELRTRATEERNVAKERLTAHANTCPACNQGREYTAERSLT
jgi:hypothetical protein